MALDGYRYLGNYSAVDPAYSRGMSCDDCRVSWTGCWDNFQCPLCGRGELPSAEIKERHLRVVRSQEAVKRLNDFSYLEERRRKNRPGNDQLRLQENLEELKRLHGELRGILDELEEAVR